MIFLSLILHDKIGQDTTVPALDAPDNTLSVIDLITSGGIGGRTIIFVLFLLSIITIYVFVERFLAIKSAGKIDPNFINNIKDLVSNDRIDSADILCKQIDSPVSRMIGKGISVINKPLKDIEASIQNVGKIEIYNLEKNIGILATIAGVGPMIGFLGTVIGMVLAFHEMSVSGGHVDVQMLSKGIYTAMTTTIAGLIVGIFAYVLYNFLVVKTDKVIHKMEANTTEFLDLLNKPS
ncbi:MotA/TolQ/ExbB proton channel family protein [Ichthyobacterium seriolicida]|uniref:MotA/TolQ/ExbB proton channel family protein n=1 Tax=Ichthyobacterium seriolicida TaxID=242600 RepID=A0A1J1DWY2_9FLAO|nr:MotA/TolQ/ExbB proton channel family protein [Ichthyobacterium seriolicida]BAV94367.1 MotA/TolQ/ExbB proton channel family protein [Ichthyobacterium seriolicida]